MKLFKKKSVDKSFDPHQEPSGILTVAYVVALAFIALLGSTSHFLIIQMTNAQKDTTEIVYMAGRQRLTVQQMALHAADYNETRSDEDKALIENAYFSFKLGHDYLINGDPNRAQARYELSDELKKIYFEEPYNLDRQAKSYLNIAENLLKLEKDDPQIERKLRIIYRALSDKAVGSLLQALDVAAQQYQKEALDKISRLTFMQTMVFTILIMTLIIEALFIFKPLVTHVREYSRQLMEMALKDTLTGLNNRRAFTQQAEKEMSRAARYREDLCVVLSDIDKFKSVNDTYGHAAGDKVLIDFANILEDAFRKEDVIGRIGGEEFAFVLPNTDAENGKLIVEKVRQIVENTPSHIKDENGNAHQLKYTSSFGLVYFSDYNEDLSSLLNRADMALYEAKETGRNKVIVAKGATSRFVKVVDKENSQKDDDAHTSPRNT